MKEDKKLETEGSAKDEMGVKAGEETEGSLKDALETKKKELSDFQDKYLRLYAEFENFKKIVAKDQTELLRYGHEKLIIEILPVIDNLERAITHAKDFTDRLSPEGMEILQGFVSGIEMIHKQIMDALTRFGLKPINATGEHFDPSRHHAVSQVESMETEPNTVIEELNKGYFLNDRVIRPSMVVVSKKDIKETECSPDVGDALDKTLTGED